MFFHILVTAQWKRLPISNEPPPPRAYHSMTCIGARHLLVGGFDGKSTFGDIWWLVPEGILFLFLLIFYLQKLVNLLSFCLHASSVLSLDRFYMLKVFSLSRRTDHGVGHSHRLLISTFSFIKFVLKVMKFYVSIEF